MDQSYLNHLSKSNERISPGLAPPASQSRQAESAAVSSSAQSYELAAQAGVLIVCDQADFARSVVARWQMERSVPAFTMMSSEVCRHAPKAVFGVAIVAPQTPALAAVLNALQSCETPVILVSAGEPLNHASSRSILLLRQGEGWVDVLIGLAKEVLLRREALARMQRAEQSANGNQRLATLGRYMLEMRHSLNNCLTSVLGNAELLLLEPGLFTADTRDQIHTIHTMALRMHEVLHRFSSLESEMQSTENESQSETKVKSQAASGRR
jgi:signal transduction histidine kinase